MSTEGEKKIKRKFRLHKTHYASGQYQERHHTTSSRILFVVADVRDPLLAQPADALDWRRRIGERVSTLNRWAQEEGMNQLFWFAPGHALTEVAVWREPVWLRPNQSDPISFFS